MKKRWIALISLVFVLIVIAGFSALVSAQYSNLGSELARGSEMLMDLIKSVFGPFFGAFFGGTGEFLFEKVLFFFIILSLTYVSLLKIPMFRDNLAIMWIVTFAVALLATRFLTEVAWIKTILLSYSVLGIALTSFIPFIVFFLFIESFESSVLRRIAWIFVGAVFIGLWIARYNELGAPSWIYFAAAVAALIFFLLSKTIHIYYIMHFLGAGGGGYDQDMRILAIRREITQSQMILDNPRSSPDDRRRAKRVIKDQKMRIKDILKGY